MEMKVLSENDVYVFLIGESFVADKSCLYLQYAHN